MQCDSCPYTIQPRGTQAAQGFCRLSTPYGEAPTLAACLQPNPDSTCSACREGFYLNRFTNLCVACPINATVSAGCARCSETGCSQCLEGFALVNQQCRRCELQTQNRQFYTLMRDNRCYSCDAADVSQCKYCSQGWTGSEFKHRTFLNPALSRAQQPAACNLKCRGYQYPKVTYEADQVTVRATTCVDCASNCTKCVGPTWNDCQECKDSNHYIGLMDAATQAGRCLQKQYLGEAADETAALDPRDIDATRAPPAELQVSQVLRNKTARQEYTNIFVSNLIDERPTKANPARQRRGTFDDPFATLTDALVRAQEIIVPFYETLNVTIHLFKGDHYLLDNRFDALNIYT